MDDPRKRLREQSGHYLDDMIDGILIGFAHTLRERGDHIDIITVREAKKEIKSLIKEHALRIQKELDQILEEVSDH